VVQIQSGSVQTEEKKMPVKNIIASFNPEKNTRILLAAHWDTRPVSDRDEKFKDKPFDGANDGASGVGVLLEIARQASVAKPNLGIDIIFFDMEDYGKEYCLGSAYWAKNFHKPGYSAQYGILLDMIGAKDAVFPREGLSRQYAPYVVKKIWNKAAHLGYSHYFIFQDVHELTDDHANIILLANIPCVNIIHFDPVTNDFGTFHHRQSDNMSIIDKNTLKAVGQTVLEVVWEEQSGKKSL
jgi:Zn-dependent M28 family amino/carboxypeptidase